MFSVHDAEKMQNFLKENKFPNFRYGQIENAIYKNFIENFDEIQTIPKDLRNLLKENFFYYSIKCVKEQKSENGQTIKYLFETQDGLFIESVLMQHLTGRNTLCISSQVGCPMGCKFCATGKLGLKRNLQFYEIIDQVYFVASKLFHEGKVLRNVVYMGMGEPFLNYENVKKSIQILCEQKKLNLSNRKITVSTCGILDGILNLANDFPQVSLAISLHASNNLVRDNLMPINKQNNLEKLFETLDKYVEITNKRIFYEYIMIDGENDDLAYAEELGKLLKGRLAHVNFIPYNSGEGKGGTYKQTNRKKIIEFQKILEKFGIPSTIRATMGDDIDAACGQLATKK